MSPGKKRLLPARIILFLLIMGLFALSTVLIPRIAFHFTKLLPDNFSYTARRAIDSGDFATAEKITRQRLEKEFYDFNALYLLAEALDRDGRSAEAAEAIKDVLTRVPGALSRKESKTGYDESQTFCRLAIYLWHAGAFSEAGEMARAALDIGTASGIAEVKNEIWSTTHSSPKAAVAAARLALRAADFGQFKRALAAASALPVEVEILSAAWTEQRERNPLSAETQLRAALSRSPSDPTLRLALRSLLLRHNWTDPALETAIRIEDADNARVLPLASFSLPTGAELTTSGLTLSRTSTAVAHTNTGVFPVHSLLMVASGSKAMGLYPILIVRSGETEVSRYYLDSPRPTLFKSEPWPDGAPKSLDLRLNFSNDGYDPVSRADRNMIIYDLAFH